MGFGISHQKAGLNWPGRYREAIQNAELKMQNGNNGNGAPQRRGDAENGKSSGNGNGRHAKWRRITGITVAVEGVLTAKERKAGLKRLVAWIENEIQNETDVSGQLSVVSGNDVPTELSLTTAFGRAVEEWAGATGNSVERPCVELEISRARLTMLTKEYCGMTAQELVDGFKIRRVKRGLIERLRAAAQALWGLPGSYAATKYEAPMDANNPHGQPTADRGCPWHTPMAARGTGLWQPETRLWQPETRLWQPETRLWQPETR